MKPEKPVTRWAVQWRCENRIDGKTEHIMWDAYSPYLFRTRSQARVWIESALGYIRKRPDLQAEPHGWKIPIPVRVAVIIKPI